MQIQMDTSLTLQLHADALVTYVFDQDEKIEGRSADIDEAMDGRLAALATAENYRQNPANGAGPFSRGLGRKAVVACRGREARQVFGFATCARLPAPLCVI